MSNRIALHNTKYTLKLPSALLEDILRSRRCLVAQRAGLRGFCRKNETLARTSGVAAVRSYPLRFVLVAHPRSGSTFLSHALGQYEGLVMFGELFNPDLATRTNAISEGLQFRWFKGRYPDPYAPNEQADDYLARLHAVASSMGARAMGFTIHYEHAWESRTWSSVWRWLARDKEVPIIHLYRRDLLRSYVSALIAAKTDEWVSTVEHPARTRNGVCVKVKVPEFRNYLRQSRGIQRMVRHWSATRRVLHLCYEDTIENKPEWAHRSTSAFLGIAPQQIETFVVKMPPFRVAEAVVNYVEISHLLQNGEHLSLE